MSLALANEKCNRIGLGQGPLGHLVNGLAGGIYRHLWRRAIRALEHHFRGIGIIAFHVVDEIVQGRLLDHAFEAAGRDADALALREISEGTEIHDFLGRSFVLGTAK